MKCLRLRCEIAHISHRARLTILNGGAALSAPTIRLNFLIQNVGGAAHA